MPAIRRVVNTDRGLGHYGAPVKTDHGHTVRVQDSSAMRAFPCAWMRVEGEAMFRVTDEQVAALQQAFPDAWSCRVYNQPGMWDISLPGASMGVHLTPVMVRSVIKRLALWLTTWGEKPA